MRDTREECLVLYSETLLTFGLGRCPFFFRLPVINVQIQGILLQFLVLLFLVLQLLVHLHNGSQGFFIPRQILAGEKVPSIGMGNAFVQLLIAQVFLVNYEVPGNWKDSLVQSIC